MLLTASDKKRFWEKVQKTPTCWVWTASRKSGGGYGNFIVGRRVMVASRVSWELHFGAIPDGKFVCHRCDNPPCVRPDHLFIGDAKDNRDDMIAKGRLRAARGDSNGSRKHPERLARGAANQKTKLTEEQVREIRRAYDPNTNRGPGTLLQLGKRFGVNRTTISEIVKRTTWSHVK